jgi:hypothetical protein
MAALVEDYDTHDEVQVIKEWDQNLKSITSYATTLSIFNSREERMFCTLLEFDLSSNGYVPPNLTSIWHSKRSERESKGVPLSQMVKGKKVVKSFCPHKTHHDSCQQRSELHHCNSFWSRQNDSFLV